MIRVYFSGQGDPDAYDRERDEPDEEPDERSRDESRRWAALGATVDAER